LWIVAANAANVAFAWRHVDFDVRDACAVLTTIMLLFHQQIHFIEAVKSSSVFLGVMLKRLLQSEECDTTLVLELITHDALAIEIIID
jgi:hypothetical protein